MAIDGTWNLTMETPMGERKSKLTLKASGGALTGSQEAEGNTTDIFEGSANGDDLVVEGRDHQPDAADADVQRFGERQHDQRQRRHRHVRQLPVRGNARVTRCHPRPASQRVARCARLGEMTNPAGGVPCVW